MSGSSIQGLRERPTSRYRYPSPVRRVRPASRSRSPVRHRTPKKRLPLYINILKNIFGENIAGLFRLVYDNVAFVLEELDTDFTISKETIEDYYRNINQIIPTNLPEFHILQPANKDNVLYINRERFYLVNHEINITDVKEDNGDTHIKFDLILCNKEILDDHDSYYCESMLKDFAKIIQFGTDNLRQKILKKTRLFFNYKFINDFLVEVDDITVTAHIPRFDIPKLVLKYNIKLINEKIYRPGGTKFDIISRTTKVGK